MIVRTGPSLSQLVSDLLRQPPNCDRPRGNCRAFVAAGQI
jgi:hypothetical protein